MCDPGWTGPLCHQLDLAPLPVGFTGGAWNSELSPRSSWGAAPHRAADGKYHGWFNQLPDKCGLSSWLPGSYIEHGVADSPLGPFTLVKNAPPTDGKPDPLSGKDRFATNPHVAYVKSEGRYLLFFNGREWPANDLTNCWPSDNKTDTDGSHFHGGGSCSSDADCAGAFAGTDAHQGGAANICNAGKCSCEHHSMGPRESSNGLLPRRRLTPTVAARLQHHHGDGQRRLLPLAQRPLGAAQARRRRLLVRLRDPRRQRREPCQPQQPGWWQVPLEPVGFRAGQRDGGAGLLEGSGRAGGHRRLRRAALEVSLPSTPHHPPHTHPAHPRLPCLALTVLWRGRGPYTRLTLPFPGSTSKSPFKSGKNYSIVGCGEDPFIYKGKTDARAGCFCSPLWQWFR